jgi:hypothetical protein
LRRKTGLSVNISPLILIGFIYLIRTKNASYHQNASFIAYVDAKSLLFRSHTVFIKEVHLIEIKLMTHKNEELKHLGHNLNQEFYCHVLEFLGN